MTGQDDGALGVADQLCGLREALIFDTEHWVRPIGFRLGRFKVEDRGSLLRILRNVNEHWAGAAGLCDLEGLTQHLGKIFSAADEKVVLGYGKRDAGDVHFLDRK